MGGVENLSLDVCIAAVRWILRLTKPKKLTPESDRGEMLCFSSLLNENKVWTTEYKFE